MDSVITITRPVKSDYEFDDEFESEDFKKEEGIVTPGELVTDDPVWMKGHGTYFVGDSLYSSVAGQVSRVNRLLSVVPLRGRYAPETGDHVVGRITEVGSKRWKVDIGGKQDAILMLGSVNLPGGVLRRKSELDELAMRSFLKEGDLLNAEVQSVYASGVASLHTRSLKYGKLRNGMFTKVPLGLIVKSKNHSWDMPGNVSTIVGVNGYIWLYQTNPTTAAPIGHMLGKTQAMVEGASKHTSYQPGQGSVLITRLEEESSWEIYSDKNDIINSRVRNNIARYYNVLQALSHSELGINQSRMIMGYEISLTYEEEPSDMNVKELICQEILRMETMRGGQ
ncbi:exosome non-catalytic core subunit rrp4 [Scheffersomyces spartinae]|uniref:Exosome non-catalytic core subunit rrp4 n=1 Tax=Scheffersomyces spartinae TaxID=45513 RepID=A0A9P7V6U6_9ASCO|nr:exosome non-catalytic core subunit rrp4 [Scheffersomyces spartinae]KAG7191990.1 exosome non-catalytic core subunit rrp4 [Scheffersomyces spartinae]